MREGGTMYSEQQKRFFTLTKRFGRLKSRFKTHNFSHTEFIILGTIAQGQKEESEKEEPGILVSQITSHFGSSKSSTSKILRALEEKGYIERNLGKKDKRQMYVTLTEKGESCRRLFQKQMDDYAEKVIERMGEKDIDTLLVLMEKLYGIMEEEAKNLTERKE